MEGQPQGLPLQNLLVSGWGWRKYWVDVKKIVVFYFVFWYNWFWHP